MCSSDLFDMMRDFAPVTQVSSVSSLMYVHPSVPVKTLREFIALARAHPGKLYFSSSGSGGIPHLAGELLNSLAGVRTNCLVSERTKSAAH